MARADTAPSLAEIGIPYAPGNPPGAPLRVALVNPPDPSSTDAWNRWIPPLGLGYVASVARHHGFHVDLFDFAPDGLVGAEQMRATGLLGYDVYGFASYSEIWPSILRFVRTLRALQPRAVFVLGGYHGSSAGEAVLRDVPEIDFVVAHEGEVPFTELLRALASNGPLDAIRDLMWRDGNGQVVRNPERTDLMDLDLLPYPARDYVHAPPRHWNMTLSGRRANKPTVSMVSSRGCPKRCTFCSIIVLSPNYRKRSAASMMQEVEALREAEPFEHIMFQDANFFVKVARTTEFARALHAYDPRITWSGTATADQVSKHAGVLNEIGRLNCAYLEIGIESGNDNSLTRFNKRTTVAQNDEALRLLAAAGIGIGLDFIMFEPDMTFADLLDNVAFLHRNDLFGYFPTEHLFQELRLFPGTPLREHYAQRLGVRFDDHIMPQTPFFERAVELVWRCMQWYVVEYHMAVGRLMREIIEPVNRVLFHERAHERVDRELAELCQAAHGALVRLRHLPYRFLEELLGRRAELEAGLEPARVAELIDCAPFDRTVSAARDVLGALRERIAILQLEEIAGKWQPASVR